MNGDTRYTEYAGRIAELFMRHGIHSMTMDDIANQLHISKKTLYRYFDNKADLVGKVMHCFIESESERHEKMAASSENAIDEIMETGAHVKAMLQKIHRSIHFDLEKYYPDSWEQFKHFRDDLLVRSIENNLVQGMKQGLYRHGLNVPVIARLYIKRIDIIFDDEIFPLPDFDFYTIYRVMLDYHIRGIATDKGLKYFIEQNDNDA